MTALVLPVLAAAAPLLWAADVPTAADTDQLLGGVSRIAIVGTPGSICVTAPQAFPLVAAEHDGQLVAVVAAARFGRGRAVEFGHDGYFGREALQGADTGRFMVNAVRWAAGGRVAKGKNPRVGLRHAGDLAAFFAGQGFESLSLDGGDWLSQLGACDVLVAEAGAFAAPEELSALKTFVEGGGGLVAAGCPWGWAQVSGRPLRTEYPPNRLLGPAGLVAAETYVVATTDGGFRVVNPPEKLLHAHTALDVLIPRSKSAEQSPSPADAVHFAQAVHTVTLAAQAVAPGDIQLLPRLRSIVEERGGRAVPMPGKPIRIQDGFARVLVAAQDAEMRSLPPEKAAAHPAAAGFPYDVPAGAARVTKKIEVDTTVPDWHSTGLYAPPGEIVEVAAPEAAAGKGLGVRVGAHTDGIWRLDAWERWPAISWRASLDKPITRLANPFGGLIYIEVPRDSGLGAISVRVAGAVEAPYYVLGKTDEKEWRATIRSAPAPWAELECSGIILTVPSKAVRRLDDPKGLMTFWDRVLKAEDRLARWKPEDRRRPERMVCDQQISAGYMHAGYPVMTLLDAAETNVSVSKLTTVGEKGWGQWHELGHNHQDEMWTPDGTGEVTVNLFTLYVLNTVGGLSLEEARPEDLRRERRIKKIQAYLASDRTPAAWDPFTGLVFYFQLIDGFGWDALKRVIGEYRGRPGPRRPEGDVAKWDQWMTRYSRAVGRNLGPFFTKWKIPVTPAALDAVKGPPEWMHPDFKAASPP